MSDPKAVRVRIAVAIDEEGDWYSRGDRALMEWSALESAAAGVRGSDRARPVTLVWVEADVTVPTAPVIPVVQGSVYSTTEGDG